jgi:hypothetical protein
MLDQITRMKSKRLGLDATVEIAAITGPRFGAEVIRVHRSGAEDAKSQ